MGQTGAHAAVEALISPLTYLPNYLNPQMTQKLKPRYFAVSGDSWHISGVSGAVEARKLDNIVLWGKLARTRRLKL